MYLGQFIGALLSEHVVPMSGLKECFAPLLQTRNRSGVLLVETMKCVRDKLVSY